MINSTDLHIIADDILASVKMLELADEDTIEMDLDTYLPRIRRNAEDLNSKAASMTEEKQMQQHIPTILEIMGLEPEPVEQPIRKDGPDQDDPLYEVVKVKKTMTSHQARRINSELALEQSLPWHFEKGVAYHCISAGDVDSLTYLRVIVKQQHIKYAILSTWCMAAEDIKEIESWLVAGYIDRIDFFCGEIFRGTYAKEYNMMKNLCRRHGCKMSIFRNHSKVMLVYGEQFNAVIESSANINTNPRTEQTCITLDDDLCDFYLDFYNGIVSFEREFDHVEKWTNSRNDHD